MKAFRRVFAVAYLLSTLLLVLLPELASAATRKPLCTVRFHLEVRSASEDPFSIPVKLQSPAKQIFIESSASISERQVEAVHFYPASDGSWGCLFKLDNSGRIALATVTSGSRGRCMVFFLGTEQGSRQVLDILIDRPVNDGILPVSRGLTWQEVEMLRTQFPPKDPKKRARNSQ